MKPGTGDNGGAGLILGKRKRKHTPSFGFDQQQHQRRENLLSTAQTPTHSSMAPQYSSLASGGGQTHNAISPWPREVNDLRSK
jgi:hypothetical protein